jgi:hypothetical protein
MHRAVRRIGWLAVVGILIGVVPAGASSNGTLLRKAAEATFAGHSAQLKYVISLSAPGHGSYTVMELTGQEQFSAPTKAAFTVSVPTSSGNGSKRFQALLVGTIFYFDLQGTWYSETSQQALASEGLSGSLSDGSNPANILGVLYQEGARVKRLGRVRLGGTETIEYRSVVNLDKAAVAGAPYGIAMTPQALQKFKQLTGKSSVTADVWVDGAGVLRQLQVTLPLQRSALAGSGMQGAPSGVKETMSVAFSKFGTPVSVSPPATAKPLQTTSGQSA